jgi:hypothetical protein
MEIEKKAESRSVQNCRLHYKVLGNVMTLQNSRTGKIYIALGPHWPGVVFTTALIIFCASLSFNMSSSISNMYVKNISFYFSVFLAICAELFLCLTALVDPGIIRSERKDTDDTFGLLDHRNSYCDICEVYQSPGCGHCDTCNVCIAKLDHHCPWMGKCIGQFNMKWFVLFITTCMIYFLQLFIVLIFYSNK